MVVVVFCDSEDVRFDPLEIHSQFNHVFVLVVPQPRAANGKRQYRIAVVRKPGVPVIQPLMKVRVCCGLDGDRERQKRERLCVHRIVCVV